MAGDGFDTAFYAEAASAREYAQRYGEDGQAQRESALKQLEGTGYEELVMQGLQAEQNSAYREKAAAFLESFMKGEYIPDVQLGELWQSAQAWQRQRTQAGSRQDTAVQTAGANTAREGLNPVPGTAYNESMPNAAEGLTVGESLTEGNGYAAAGEMFGEWAEGAGGAKDIPQIRKNAAQGRAYEQQEFSKFSNKANEAVEQITIKTSEGTKIRVDAIGVDKDTEKVVINEFKSSQTAPLTPNQKVGFPQLEAGGGVVVGKGKGIFTEGFEIPAGTKVEIIRPLK